MAWDGIQWPKIVVQAGFGGPPDNVCVRGTGVRGTNIRGGPSMVDISADVRSIEIQRGRDSEFDAASPGTCTLLVDNSSGNYDPLNLNSPYVANRLSKETEGLEGGTVGGWVVGGSCTIANSTTQAHSGTHSLALTSTVGSGGIWSNTTTGIGGINVQAHRGLPYKTSLWARSQSHAVSVLVAMLWYDEGGDLLQQDNGSSVATSTSGWAQATIAGTVPGLAAYAAVQALFFNMASIGEVHYVDDAFFATGTSVDIGAPVVVWAEWPVGMVYKRFTGKIADVALDISGPDSTVTLTCADALEDLGRVQLATEVAQFGGDTSGQRVNNILDRAAWPATARLVDGGQETLIPTTFGAGALELLRQVERTEFGFLFANADNNLVFYGRHRAETANRSVIVQATFTDHVSVVSIGVAAKSRERVINDAHATRQPDPSQDPELTGSSPGDVPVEQVAQNTASINAPGNYGPLSLPSEVGTLAQSDVAVKGLLQGIVGVYGTPRLRIRELTVDVLADGHFDTLLPLGLLDRIAVDCNYGPNRIQGQLLIQAQSETIQRTPSPVWTMRLTTSNPPPVTHYCVRGEGVRGTDIRGW